MESSSLTLTDEQKDRVAVELLLLKSDRLAHRQEPLPEWFLRKLDEADTVKETLKKMYKELLAEYAAKRRAFILEWGPEFRDTVKADLASVNKSTSKPRKTIKYLTGQAGTRKSQDKLVVWDDKLAAKWAWENPDCRSACDITLARTTPLLDHLKKTGEEIPGCTFVAAHDAPSPRLEELDALPKPVDRPVITSGTGTSKPDDPFGDMLDPVPQEQPF